MKNLRHHMAGMSLLKGSFGNRRPLRANSLQKYNKKKTEMVDAKTQTHHPWTQTTWREVEIVIVMQK